MTKFKLDYCFLESCELFFDIPSSTQMEVMASACARCFARHEALFFAGDRIAEVLLLVDGYVKITQLNDRGTEVILRLRKPGDLIVMPDWEPKDIHSSTAQALVPCKVLAWSAQAFETAKERFPQLQCNVNGIIEDTLNKLQRRYCVVATAKVELRLVHGLVHAIEAIGQTRNNHVEIHLSREELGQMVAVSPSEVSRALSRWQRQGLVRLRREVIEVPSVTRLLSFRQAKCLGLTEEPVSHFPSSLECSP